MTRRIPEKAAGEVAVLFLEAAPDLRRFAMRLVQGDAQAAEGLVQEVFHDAALAWSTLRDRHRTAQRAWLFAVAKNKAFSRWRSEARRLSGLIEEARRLDPALPRLVALRAVHAHGPEVGAAIRQGERQVLLAVDDGTELDDPEFGGADLLLMTAQVEPGEDNTEGAA